MRDERQMIPSAAHAAREIRDGRLTSDELVQACLERRQGAADHRGRHAELARRRRQAARLDHLGKHRHAVDYITHVAGLGFALFTKEFCDSPLF